MKKIKICTIFDFLNSQYVSFFEENFEVEWFDGYEENCDIALFTGGPDVDPSIYGEDRGFRTYSHLERDLKEIEFFNKLDSKVLKVGICKGSQLLTVLSGGSLIQHVDGHMDYHNILTKENQVIPVTSDHHQMMFPFSIDNEEYELIAKSEFKRGSKYLNGKNIQIKLPENFVEPEIVFYKNTNSFCCQGHPEYSDANDLFKQFFIQQVNKNLQN